MYSVCENRYAHKLLCCFETKPGKNQGLQLQTVRRKLRVPVLLDLTGFSYGTPGVAALACVPVRNSRMQHNSLG